MAHFQYSQSKITGLNKSRTILHAVQYKWHSGSVLMICYYHFQNGKPRNFVLIFRGTASLASFLACPEIFCPSQCFCSYKIVLIKKSVISFWYWDGQKKFIKVHCLLQRIRWRLWRRHAHRRQAETIRTNIWWYGTKMVSCCSSVWWWRYI